MKYPDQPGLGTRRIDRVAAAHTRALSSYIMPPGGMQTVIAAGSGRAEKYLLILRELLPG